MTEMVLDIKMVPDAIFSHIKTEKVNFRAENGTVVLTPVAIEKEKSFDRLLGMFSDGTISVDGFLREKRIEKQIEEELED
ncbi:hypothetical protein R80B4_01060 [Fibrobacteres bacterium R8-0-B4]